MNVHKIDHSYNAHDCQATAAALLSTLQVTVFESSPNKGQSWAAQDGPLLLLIVVTQLSCCMCHVLPDPVHRRHMLFKRNVCNKRHHVQVSKPWASSALLCWEGQ
jgi:hypothetical protein